MLVEMNHNKDLTIFHLKKKKKKKEIRLTLLMHTSNNNKQGADRLRDKVKD